MKQTRMMCVSSNTNSNNNNSNKNVGILALEVYTPRTFIDQGELEAHHGVPAGKYTVGLGQHGLAVTGDAEDINSICLTAVHSLLEKYEIDPSQVGRLEVGTETLVDKSKSTKTVLMDLFSQSGNTDIEGATVVNACYGGTAALLNAFLWCESDGWDGRFAVVVAGDIATYDAGPARPTCGAGAVAVLIGRDAPLVFNPRTKATHASNVWDFYKPNPAVEYPVVDGALSQACYYAALEDCYGRFVDQQQAATQQAALDATTVADYLVFHAPYNKLVQKSYARLFLMDAKRRRQAACAAAAETAEEKKEICDVGMLDNDSNRSVVVVSRSDLHDEMLAEWLHQPTPETYTDKKLEKVLKSIAAPYAAEKMADANAASIEIGNTYTASVFFGLASLVERAGRRGELTPNKTIAVFSYGSGALATMYGLTVREPTRQCNRFTIQSMVNALDLTQRLACREKVHPAELDRALDTRARMHTAGAPYTPVYPTVGRLFPGTYYLKEIDGQWRRTYARVPLNDAVPPVAAAVSSDSTLYRPLAPPSVVQAEQDQKKRRQQEEEQQVKARVEQAKPKSISDNDAPEFSERSVPCLITGTAVGLPGGGAVFRENNVERLLAGEQCIQPVSEAVRTAMLEKNIVQLKRHPDKTTERIPLNSAADMIQLSAQLGTFCMTKSYGVPEGLAKTMDTASQVAVAAGLEALKNAGLVSGRSNEAAEWRIPERYQDSTGVVYASSFPALDAAIGEVMRCLQHSNTGVEMAQAMRLIAALRSRMVDATPDGTLTDEDEAAFAHLLTRATTTTTATNGSSDNTRSSSSQSQSHYEFDRKFLFRVLVLGNAQLAQLAGCRGPNTQTNAACAGTTQAIAMAQDMIVAGRAKRVVVIAGDNASGDTLMPWLGSGFRVLGAATNKPNVEQAAVPFDKRRCGMVLGAGGIGLVLESETSARERLQLHETELQEQQHQSPPLQQLSSSLPPPPPPLFTTKARLLATRYSNSAYHGAALDRNHIGLELIRFLTHVEQVYGITKEEIAEHGVYFSHETGTHASDASSCAGNEVAALRRAFGNDNVAKLLILNTKGFTGHPMGVSFEDVAAVEVLNHQTVPAISNHQQEDDYLGPLNLSKTAGPYACRYALRFAAGFGSQVAFALYATATAVGDDGGGGTPAETS